MKQFLTAWTAVLLLTVAGLSACSSDDHRPDDPILPDPELPGAGTNDDNAPDFDFTIRDYEGERADDAANDQVGTNEDLYWEANTWKQTITVTYTGTTATVESSTDKVTSHIDGAHVVLDLYTESVSSAEIVVHGKSDDGSLKIYGQKKFKLTLAGVELTSTRGPALNSQCKKRAFVHLADGTTNRLTDADAYTTDTWYLDDAAPDDEDRKGCFFSEGNLIFSGTGALVVSGRQRHGIATDGYMYTRPGTTIAVLEAAKNAIHVKGDKDDAMGLYVAGGLLYTQTASPAGKGIKTDLHVHVAGGRLDLNTTGDAIYEADSDDTSSAAGIKADGDIVISAGTITITSTGMGGKGLNADGQLHITGGTTTITTTGGKYVYDAKRDLDASPKGAKAEGDIVIDGGMLNIAVTGVSDGSEGLESKSRLTINGGELYIYAYDDAINAATDITVNGGRVYAYAVQNDGIDSNGTLTFNGGLVIAFGTSAPEEAFDCDRSTDFRVNGGTLIGMAGAAIAPSSASTQRTVIYNGIQASKGELLTVLDATGSPVATCVVPRSLSGGLSLFFSSPALTAGATYTVCKGGTLSAPADEWHGWYDGGTWSGGQQVGSFTSNSIVTTIGQSNGPGGGGGNPPGGRW